TSDTVSLIFDIWSLQAHDSYIRITCHWIIELFELHKIILEIGELDDHYASDIVESVNSVFDKFKINNQKIFFIITDNSANVKTKASRRAYFKVQTLVSILSKEKKRKQLHKAQLQINLELKEPLDVIKDIRKEAEMMSSFLPSKEEFELLEELIVILSLFDKATQFLSGSKYPTLFMTPMLEELARQLKYFTGHNEEAIFVREQF
ncbi:7192_t:CDS:2, partial [Gigaspora margarita]